MENTSHCQNIISYSFLYITAVLHGHLVALLIYINFPSKLWTQHMNLFICLCIQRLFELYKDNTDNT